MKLGIEILGNYWLRSMKLKLFSDVALMAQTIMVFEKIVPNSARLGIPLLVVVYLTRGFAYGFFIPYSIAFIVDGLRGANSNSIKLGVGLLVTLAVVFVVTEIAQMFFFKKLPRIIVTLKQLVVKTIENSSNASDDREDLVGKISSDVDFIVWNVNAFLTTLLPNLFTALTALFSTLTFNISIGLIVTSTLTPYIVYAEVYSRIIEKYRSQERRAYAQSVVYVKNIVYGDRSSREDLDNVLLKWEHAINKIMWMDRYYFALGFTTCFLSISYIAILAIRRVEESYLGIGAFAGMLYASLSAHIGMLNAMWAFCIQGQTIATIKRILSYIQLVEKLKSHEKRTVHIMTRAC